MIKVLILAGASAVGKTTVGTLLVESGKFELVRSATTREKRDDAFGSEYIYLTRNEFLKLVSDGGVLEHTEYAGHLYGTPRSEIERISGEGRTPLISSVPLIFPSELSSAAPVTLQTLRLSPSTLRLGRRDSRSTSRLALARTSVMHRRDALRSELRARTERSISLTPSITPLLLPPECLSHSLRTTSMPTARLTSPLLSVPIWEARKSLSPR